MQDLGDRPSADETVFDVALSGAHPDKRPNRTSTHRKETSVEFSIAIQALQNAREGASELRPGMLEHQREKVLIDPYSQLELAEKAIRAIRARWERGGV